MSAKAPRRCELCAATLEGDAVCARCLINRRLPVVELGGHLLLGDELGQGGMGTVFRAEDTRLHRDVAVKLLSEELAHDPGMRARLEREARALAQLSHPNIVQVFEVGDDAGQPYLVMELIEGKPLSKLLPISATRAAELGAQVCDALAHAHAKSIVHRDVKPENVLIDALGRAHLADFGIARSLSASQSVPALTAPSLQAGTPSYLAPELLDGAAADARSDIYSAGVLIYQAVTGRFPRGDFERLPGPLDAIVRRALSRDPARRHQSAGELRDALLRLVPNAGHARDERPDEEQFLTRGAAILCAAATGVSLWSALQALTPRVINPGEMLPLLTSFTERLPDGRYVSYARFETGPILFSALALALAFACLALLRKHWRQTGLDAPRPLEPIAESRWVLALGVLSCLVWIARRAAQDRGIVGPAIYAPFFGGLLELYSLYLFFLAMLHAWQSARPLRREPWLFAGFALVLVPPVSEFLSYLSRWRP